MSENPTRIVDFVFGFTVADAALQHSALAGLIVHAITSN
jgi:hypothetical protein